MITRWEAVFQSVPDENQTRETILKAMISFLTKERIYFSNIIRKLVNLVERRITNKNLREFLIQCLTGQRDFDKQLWEEYINSASVEERKIAEKLILIFSLMVLVCIILHSKFSVILVKEIFSKFGIILANLALEKELTKGVKMIKNKKLRKKTKKILRKVKRGKIKKSQEILESLMKYSRYSEYDLSLKFSEAILCSSQLKEGITITRDETEVEGYRIIYSVFDFTKKM